MTHINYNESVQLIRESGKQDMSLADAVRTLVQDDDNMARRAFTLVYGNNQLTRYDEVISIYERSDFDREAA